MYVLSEQKFSLSMFYKAENRFLGIFIFITVTFVISVLLFFLSIILLVHIFLMFHVKHSDRDLPQLELSQMIFIAISYILIRNLQKILLSDISKAKDNTFVLSLHVLPKLIFYRFPHKNCGKRTFSATIRFLL